MSLVEGAFFFLIVYAVC